MDNLFLSKRIFVENREFIDGGVLVTPKGKIRAIFRSQTEVNSWMYANEAHQVNLLYILSIVERNEFS